jgi:RNA polymerase sigma-54 factor
MSVLGLEAVQRYEQRLWPGLVALARLLPLPVADLDAAVERELADNPALEREEHAGDCPPACSWCAVAPPRSDLADPGARDPLADARALLGAREARLADYVLGSIDERGLLHRPLGDVARETGATADELRAVVAALRASGPAWIAARDVREALLLQLDAIGGEAPALARRLVADHLPELANGSFARAAQALGVTRAEVVEARDFVRTRLLPPTGVDPPALAPARPRPDFVVVERPNGELGVDLPETRHVRVRVDPVWTRCAHDGPPAERALASELVARARAFAHTLEDRRRTLAGIASHAVTRQERFARGQGSPLPLTRAAVARGAGVHESTVSRAVSGKLVQLAGGRTVEFACFFRASLGAEDALAKIVAGESQPLSDAELARELAGLGFPVARRTVAKYRSRLGIVAHGVR